MPSDLERACVTLPLFPLPNTVLLPGAPLPLHVFEPRYRQLIKDVLGGGFLAIPQMVPDEESGSHPPFLPYAGLGKLLAHRELPDGRFNVLVQPLARVRLDEELYGLLTPYRMARATLLVDRPHVPRELEHAGARIVALVGPLLGQMGERAIDLRKGLSEMPPERVAEAVAPFVFREAGPRQDYLREDSPVARAALVETAVLEIVASLTTAVAEG